MHQEVRTVESVASCSSTAPMGGYYSALASAPVSYSNPAELGGTGQLHMQLPVLSLCRHLNLVWSL